jgi:hypothetical protein
MLALSRIALAGALVSASMFAADLFPLQEGNNWTYREPRTGGTFTVEVGAPVALNDQTYYPLTGYVPRQVLARLDDQSRLVYADPDSGQEAVLTYFTPLDGGGWWDAPLRMCGEKAQAQDKDGLVELQYQILTCADAGDLSEQYAANIGMIRRVTQSIAGPRQYDLIHAKVGGIVIDTLPYARFSVTVDSRPNTSTVMAALRLQTSSSTPVKLQFSSGQEYDLVLRSADGRIVWKWSDGRAFVEALHDRTVNGEFSVTVPVPQPPAIPEAGPITYTLQAWLTTMGDPPQYSASIPVTFGQPAN